MSYSQPTFHFHVDKTSRVSGACPVASCAYMYGEKMYDEQTGHTYSYTTKDEVVYTNTLVPDGVDESYSDPQVLWNAVEADARQYNTRYGTKGDLALPLGWSKEECIACIDEMMKEMFADQNRPVSYTLHYKENNIHAHFMFSLKTLTPDGFQSIEKKEYALDEQGEKILDGYRKAVNKVDVKPDVIDRLVDYGKYQIDPETKAKYVPKSDGSYDVSYAKYKRITVYKDPVKSPEYLERLKVICEETINKHMDMRNATLAPEYQQEHVSHLSYKDRGIQQIPTVHLGYKVSQMVADGIETIKGNENIEIKKINNRLNKMYNNVMLELVPRMTDFLNNVTSKLKLQREEISYDNTGSIESNEIDNGYEKDYPRIGTNSDQSTRVDRPIDDGKQGIEEPRIDYNYDGIIIETERRRRESEREELVRRIQQQIRLTDAKIESVESEIVRVEREQRSIDKLLQDYSELTWVSEHYTHMNYNFDYDIRTVLNNPTVKARVLTIYEDFVTDDFAYNHIGEQFIDKKVWSDAVNNVLREIQAGRLDIPENLKIKVDDTLTPRHKGPTLS